MQPESPRGEQRRSGQRSPGHLALPYSAPKSGLFRQHIAVGAWADPQRKGKDHPQEEVPFEGEVGLPHESREKPLVTEGFQEMSPADVQVN